MHVPSHDRWLVSYADFMTLLVAFFVVLFASSRHNLGSLQKVAGSIRSGFSSLSVDPPDPASHNEAYPSPAAQQKHTARLQASSDVDLPKLTKQLEDVLGDSIAKHEIVVEQRPDGLVISLRELGFFSSGQAQLLAGAADKIGRTAHVLQEHHLQVRVEGHSDDQPMHSEAFHSNWELSSARALTVLLLLVDTGGLNPASVSMGAYGPYRPLATNETAEGRKMNRRVDLVIVSPPKAVPTTQTP